METRVYNGFTYQRSGPGEPWALAGPASAAQSAPAIVTKRADPYVAREQQRKEEDQQFERQRLGLSERQFQEQRGNNAQSDQRADTSSRIHNPQDLRQEYAKIPEIRSFRVATQQAQSALNTAANPQGDLALTYAFAKAMDPDSVVRNEEQGMVINSQPWFQSAVEAVKKQFGMDGSGNFTPEARARLRQEVMRSVSSRKPIYDARRAEMADYAKTYGIDPYEVVGKAETDIYGPAFRKYAEKNGDEGGVISGLIGGDPIVPPRSTPGGGAPPMHAAGYGATQSAIPIPAGLQQAHAAYLTKNWGKIDPEDYAAFRINLDKQYGFGSDPDAYKKTVPDLNKAAAQGLSPDAGYVPPVTKELSGVDQFRNNMLSDKAGIGAGVASGLNAAAFGIPSIFAREQTQALREANPISTFIGDIAGGVAGTGLASAGLRNIAGRIGEGSVASALSKPLAGDVAYGGLYGATQADDPLYGTVGGVAAALVGNRLGRSIGRALPEATGQGGAIRALDETVPSSADLRQQASGLYQRAEANGLTATPDETLALADTTSGLLSREGRMSPTGRLTDVQPKVKEAQQLIQDYAEAPMTPTQIQTVRGVVADGLDSPEASEKRIARLLLNNFDEWTDATNPDLAAGLADARGVASRYLQGDKVAQARDLADVRAGQFSNSGQGNALRTDFRQLDRGIVKGQEQFTPEVEQAVADVARGTPVGNAFRNIGRFAPTGPVSAIPMLLAAGGGGATVGPLGVAGGLALGGLSLGARQIGQRITNRGAEVAENIAYGGPEYKAALDALLDKAGSRGGQVGTAVGSEVTRALLAAGSY